MPTHVAITPNDPLTLTAEGGSTSATETREAWNDKADAFLDTTTAPGVVLQVLASWVIGFIGETPQWGPYESFGHPLLDERWLRARVTKRLSTPDGGDTVIESNIGAGSTRSIGANAYLPIGDLAPQEGARIEIFATPPGGRGIFDVRIRFSFLFDEASTPLAPRTILASGSGVIPPDRVPNEITLLDGSEVVADNTDTVTVAKGHMVANGVTLTFLDEEVTFDLEDGDAVDLASGEQYLVTLSRDATGALVTTKGPKAEAVNHPDIDPDTALVERLTVASADGVNVTVAPASIVGVRRYFGFNARAGTGLTLLISAGHGVTETDDEQTQSHEVPVNLTASSVNRVWLLPNGSWSATVTEALPTFGAGLFFRVTTDGAGVTDIDDVKPYVHRALTEWHHESSLTTVFSQTDAGEDVEPFAWMVVYQDTEVEALRANISKLGSTWTSGVLRIDALVLPPGVPITDAGVSLFTDAATRDERLAIAFDATELRAETRFHQVRRIAKDSRVLWRLVAKPGASAPESDVELRVAIIGRRYR